MISLFFDRKVCVESCFTSGSIDGGVVPIKSEIFTGNSKAYYVIQDEVKDARPTTS